MLKLKLLNILKEEISEQGYGHYFRDWKIDDKNRIGDFRGYDFTKNKLIDKDYKNEPINNDNNNVPDNNSSNSQSSIDINKLNKDNFIRLSTKRGATYGWRYHQTKSLCSPSSPRYCDWHWHAGRDYAFPSGSKIAILKSGKITKLGPVCFTILHDDGNETKYCHCRKVFFTVGETINAGDIVAEVGNVGVSSGPHLHWEVHPSGVESKTVSHESVKPGKTQYATQDDVDPSSYEDNYVVIIKNNKEKDFKNDIISKISQNTNQTQLQNTDNSKDITVVIGGQGADATSTFMRKQWTDAGLKITDNVKFIEYTDSGILSNLKKTGNVKNIMGFSAGGSMVWKELMNNGENYKFLGFIDPSTSESAYNQYIKSGIPSNSIGLSKNENWTVYYPKIAKRLKDFENKGWSNWFKSSKGHFSIPKEFFEKYVKTNINFKQFF